MNQESRIHGSRWSTQTYVLTYFSHKGQQFDSFAFSAEKTIIASKVQKYQYGYKLVWYKRCNFSRYSLAVPHCRITNWWHHDHFTVSTKPHLCLLWLKKTKKNMCALHHFLSIHKYTTFQHINTPVFLSFFNFINISHKATAKWHTSYYQHFVRLIIFQPPPANQNNIVKKKNKLKIKSHNLSSY